MKAPFFSAARRSRSQTRAASRLALEQLELRCVLDGATLVNDVFDVGQNTLPGSLDVLANDIFPEGYAGAKRISSISFGSEGGAIEIADDGQSLRYAPPADYFGVETFTYVVDDEYTGQVQVRVQSPLAFDAYTIPPDGVERVLEVLANDPFWAGYAGARQITSVSTTSAGGEAVVADDGRSIRYTPPQEAYGEDQFIYIVDGLYPARVTVSIPETLKADQVELVQHTPGTFSLLANDPFWPNYAGARRITHVLDVDEGATAVISSDGRSITYAPAPNAAGADTIRYVVDSTYETYATVVIHRPVQDDWFETDENSTNQMFVVVANDYYRDLANVVRDVVERVTSVTQPESGGTVTISADGQSVTYSPPAGFTGSDVFTYVADGLHEATVRVQVNRPVRDDYISQGVYQDSPQAALYVLANDFLGNGYAGPRIITAVGAAEHGGAVNIGPGGQWLVYTPAAGYAGGDSFTYTVDDQLEARVTLSVQSLAQYDWYHVGADPRHGPYTLEVLSNDYFSSGYAGPGVITGVSDVTGSGSVAIVNGKSLRFTPGPTGIASFTYTVDGKYEANVSFSVQNRLQYDTAVVNQNSDVQTLDVLANDFGPIYPYGEYLGPRIITGVSASQQGGTVTISADGKSVAYRPPADFYGDDSFTYAVDGIMQSTVAVHVIRRVRDDQFRVDADDGVQRLPVLVNDLFGADYQGGQRITAVTAASAGGSVSISADGRSIQYTPAAGFSGTDAFSYTVDGRLKAEVQILVGAAHEEQFPTFGSMEAYQQFLIDDALVRYAYLFGQPAWYGWTNAGPMGPTELDAQSDGRGHSETNVQVAGVDEGDIVEFDDDYVYVLTNDELVIVDAWPAEATAVASRLDVEGRTIAEFLHGDRLTIISETGGEYLPWDYYAAAPVGGAVDGRDFAPWYYRVAPSVTLVTVVDVSNRTAPAVVQTTSMEGRYVDSRAVGGYVYVSVINESAVAPPPLVIPTEPAATEPTTFIQGVYETKEEYLARVAANPGAMIDAALPNYTSYGPDGEVVRTGLLNEPADSYRPLVVDARNLVSVVSFNAAADEPGVASTSAVYATGGSVIYASLDNFFVFDRDYSAEDGALTRIAKFDWDPSTGGVEFVAAGAVAGSIINQFSVDEHDGYVRIATTISNQGAGNWSGRAENALFVLQDDGGILESVGSLQNLALNETMRSIRFMGDQAFLTTARTIDPLFGLDLSDPADPRAIGHLTLPGFSSYMQMIDATHLLTVGQNTPTGANGPTQVALFDVSDLSQPQRIDEYTFERFSTSEAQIDHHAFGYFAVHGLLAIPTSRTYVVRVDADGDGYRETRQTVQEDELAVMTIDVDAGGSAISPAGEIVHDSAVRRSGYIGDFLYSISGDSVRVLHVDNPAIVVGEAVLVDPNDPAPPFVPNAPPEPARFPATPPVRLTDDVARAQSHLAGVLQKQAGASLLVTAETTGDASTGGSRMVLRAGGRQYLYYVRGADVVLLANQAYAFPSTVDGSAWHAIETAAGLPGDNNVDRVVDDGDLAVWRASCGADAAADADADGDSDGADFLSWQRRFGATTNAQSGSGASADFDADGDADGADFLTWQRGLGAALASGASRPGDADGDRDADAADLQAWEAAFGRAGAAASSAPASLTASGGGASLRAALSPARRLPLEYVDAALAQLLVDDASDGSHVGATERQLIRPRIRTVIA